LLYVNILLEIGVYYTLLILSKKWESTSFLSYSLAYHYFIS